MTRGLPMTVTLIHKHNHMLAQLDHIRLARGASLSIRKANYKSNQTEIRNPRHALDLLAPKGRGRKTTSPP